MNCKRLLLVSLLVANPARLMAQEANPGAAKESKPATKVLVPLRVALTVSRFEGEKKVGSLPYTLLVTANENRGHTTKLRMGVEVPVAVTTFQGPEAGRPGGAPYTSHQYRNVGTNIDCRAEGPEEGRFRLFLTVEQSSLPSTPDGKQAQAGDLPLFRTFNTEVDLLLRPGQGTQVVAATDPVTGESVRIDVAVEVVK
jgi:hypothetical protein